MGGGAGAIVTGNSYVSKHGGIMVNMSPEGIYSFDKAYGEAEKLRKRVEGGKNANYGEAEKGLETQEIEESKKTEILNFLAENLPPTEERISTPMENSCKVAVVVPAYGERHSILRMIKSLAAQEDVAP